MNAYRELLTAALTPETIRVSISRCMDSRWMDYPHGGTPFHTAKGEDYDDRWIPNTAL